MDYAKLFYNLTKKRALYNIMPIDNIPSVIENGILSFNNAPSEHKSVANPSVQERRNKTIPGGNELHSYANLYFDPRNPMMYKRRREYDNLCILAIDARILNVDGVVISDQNAARKFVKFLDPSEMQSSLDFDIIYIEDWNDPDEFEKMEKRAKKCAEILIPNRVPYEYIIGAYAANDTAADKMKQLGFNRSIKVNSYKFFY